MNNQLIQEHVHVDLSVGKSGFDGLMQNLCIPHEIPKRLYLYHIWSKPDTQKLYVWYV